MVIQKTNIELISNVILVTQIGMLQLTNKQSKNYSDVSYKKMGVSISLKFFLPQF
jgi:hypothetical protein